MMWLKKMNQHCFAPTIVSVNAVSHYVKLNALIDPIWGGVILREKCRLNLSSLIFGRSELQKRDTEYSFLKMNDVNQCGGAPH